MMASKEEILNMKPFKGYKGSRRDFVLFSALRLDLFKRFGK